MDRSQAEAFYGNYIRRCNEHRFEELGDFVHDDVEVNGESYGLAKYGEGLRQITDAFPDFFWDVQEILVDGDRLAVRLFDTGTSRDGRRISTRELAMYHVPDGRIRSVWGDLDRRRL